MKPETLSSPLVVLLAVSCMLAGGTASAAHQLDLRADVGYDSNIFDLNEIVGERDGRFSLVEAEFSAEGTSQSRWNVGVDASAAAQMFESRVSDGDEERYFVRLRGDSGGEGRQPTFDWALRLRRNDSTYVSRLTGDVGTDAVGNEIGDRFDNDTSDLRATWRAAGGDHGRISLEGSVVSKNYRTDYAALGFDRLDYEEFGVTPEYRVERSDSDFRLALNLASRQYRNRRVSDASGNPVAGTDLEYRYYGLDARYERQFTRASALEFSGGYDLREDNGGFDDRTRWNAGVEWVYRPASQTRFSVGLEWSSRVFDRPVTGDPTINDEAPEKKGYSLNMRYARPFPGLKNKGVSLFVESRWESFDSSDNVRFSYTRLQTFAGIGKQFE